LTHAELVEMVAQALAPMRGESMAILRNAASVVARAHAGDPEALAFVRSATHSDRVKVLLGQAHRALLEREGSARADYDHWWRTYGEPAGLPYVEPHEQTGLGVVIPSQYPGYAGDSDTQQTGMAPTLLGLGLLGAAAYGVYKGATEFGAYLHERSQAPAKTAGYPAEQTGHGPAGHPYCATCAYPFPWAGHAIGEVSLSPRQIGDPLEAALRTEWMGAHGLGAQYLMHDQDTKADHVPSPANPYHWLDREPESRHD
jgi:hypothetical protein